MISQFNNDNLHGTVVNTGEIYPIYPNSGVGRTHHFAVVNGDTNISLLKRNIVISGGCNSGPIEIPFFGIRNVLRENCTAAAKKKVRFTCYEMPCNENTYTGVVIKKIGTPLDQHIGDWTFIKTWATDGSCDKTCDQKIAEFVDYANTNADSPVVFTVDSVNTSRFFIEAKVAGEDFAVSSYEGLNDLTVITQNKVARLYGKDFFGWGLDTCLPTACESDKCYHTIQIEYMQETRSDRDELGSTTHPGGAFYGVLKTVMLIFDPTLSAATTKYGELGEILDGSRDPSEYLNVWTSVVTPTPVPTPAPAPAPSPAPVPTPVA